jgi:hypothetical protein
MRLKILIFPQLKPRAQNKKQRARRITARRIIMGLGAITAKRPRLQGKYAPNPGGCRRFKHL